MIEYRAFEKRGRLYGRYEHPTINGLADLRKLGCPESLARKVEEQRARKLSQSQTVRRPAETAVAPETITAAELF